VLVIVHKDIHITYDKMYNINNIVCKYLYTI